MRPDACPSLWGRPRGAQGEANGATLACAPASTPEKMCGRRNADDESHGRGYTKELEWAQHGSRAIARARAQMFLPAARCVWACGHMATRPPRGHCTCEAVDSGHAEPSTCRALVVLVLVLVFILILLLVVALVLALLPVLALVVVLALVLPPV